MKIVVSSLFLLACVFSSCSNKHDNICNIEEMFSIFEDEMGEKQIAKFKSLPEDEAVAEIYFKYSLSFRNNHLRGQFKNKELIHCFKKNGLQNIDDISYILFTSFHRHLNDKPINLEEQIKLESYADDQKRCEVLIKNRVEKYKKEFNVGDSIVVQIPYKQSNNIKEAFFYHCPVKFIDNILEIKAEIIEFWQDSSGEEGYRVNVYSTSQEGIYLYGKELSVKDTIFLRLKYSVIDANGEYLR